MLKLITTFLFTLLFHLTIAQPHIEGNLEIDMHTGFIKCDFSLSQLPELTAYRILLNKGMNIKRS